MLRVDAQLTTPSNPFLPPPLPHPSHPHPQNSQVILLDVSKDMHPHLGSISEVLSGHLASKVRSVDE